MVRIRFSVRVIAKLSIQLFLMANFDRVKICEFWKGRRFENILKLDRDLRYIGSNTRRGAL
jgi:hypothetical protein